MTWAVFPCQWLGVKPSLLAGIPTGVWRQEFSQRWNLAVLCSSPKPKRDLPSKKWEIIPLCSQQIVCLHCQEWKICQRRSKNPFSRGFTLKDSYQRGWTSSSGKCFPVFCEKYHIVCQLLNNGKISKWSGTSGNQKAKTKTKCTKTWS